MFFYFSCSCPIITKTTTTKIIIVSITMDNNITDPYLFSLQEFECSHIVELCRVYLTELYRRHYGSAKLFAWLQFEHERNNLNLSLSIKVLFVLILLTWFLESRACASLLTTTKRLLLYVFNLRHSSSLQQTREQQAAAAAEGRR